MRKCLMSLVICSTLMIVLFCVGCGPKASASEKGAIDPNIKQAKSKPAPQPDAAKAQSDSPAPGKKQSAPAQGKGGILVADKDTYDFSNVEPKQKVYGSFILKNDGDSTVKIKRNIRKSCSCVASPTLNKYVLEPGETAELKFAYTTKSQPGKVTQMLYVDVEPPSTPANLKLKIVSNVREIITVNPPRLDLELRNNAPNTITVVLESVDGDTFRIKSTNSSAQIATTDYDSNISSSRHEIVLTIDQEKLRRTPRGAIRFMTDHPKAKDVSVNFTTKLPFAAYPPTKAFINMEPGQTRKGEVKIVSNYGEKFELGEITCQKGHIEILDTVKTEDGYQINFNFSLPEDMQNRFVNDFLEVKIKDHPQEVIKIQCYGRPDTSPQTNTRRQPNVPSRPVPKPRYQPQPKEEE
ncbi:MAG: DUF1573 domain-containing protein [Sedimentisphaerales bacterium]|nr:DUF1573 domain-containing protein [Sedimentisphaerales bacterium]